ncbi:hypothetical protein ACQW02_18710 [Humitalea sp. 24SJ18S-53]|uniref:hypothetical protein n=1 Tax=Humitalea sp. 24SJ18S-53 TaxID=3422307 RepID=UPI003D669272
MTLPGTGFLALWNDHADPDGDYDLWHGREHVPERLGIPGILAVRRYLRTQGSLPEWFTLYPVADLGVLASAPYRALLGNPTPASARMRPGFANFLRRGCDTVRSFGGGLGAGLAAAMPMLAPGADLARLDRLADFGPVLSAHLGRIDAGVQSVPFTMAEPVLPPNNAVLLVEAGSPEDLAPLLADIGAELFAEGLVTAPPDWTLYRLRFALTAGDAAAVPPPPGATP